ncbi:MAG: DNA topoisomerase (ATP-hydrolyzing), partial [Anaerolineaceae bacterium]
YAMSVIVARALPDARDGLKPVQRRVLYAMYDMGIRPDSDYKKSARIVGEVLGKYHPHGDMAVYESMARLAQDFSMRYTLVDGQGNFGSVDGDPPAAMRYTEARLAKFSMELLNQIDRDTVNFLRNFDDTLDEPEVLPAAVPNLLVNGASGIAVGMATNIPPHNLNEVIDALTFMLRGWDRLDDIAISDLMKFVQGPDFPTGGIILQENQQNELLTAYATGRGRVLVRGRVAIEEMGRGRDRFIITELPYMTNKSTLIERIAELVRGGHLEGIADLRDESDRHGMRIVIELKQGAEEDKILRELYQRTPLQTTFGINLLAVVDGEPRLLTLKQALKVYLEHRILVVKRRVEFDLAKAKARAHILEGLRTAIKYLDEIIKLIRGSADTDQAKNKLMKRYKLSEVQAQAILDMPLKRLAALERKKLEDEYKEVSALIKELTMLLKAPKKLRQEVETELQAVKQNYGDRRRTQIIFLKKGKVANDLLTITDVTPAQTVWVGAMADGTIGRTHNDEMPRVSGRQAPRWLLKANTHQTLYLAARDGRAAAVAVQAIPEVEKFSDGIPVSKLSPFTEDESIVAMFVVPTKNQLPEECYAAAVTRSGMVKKSAIQELPGPSAQLFTLAKVNDGDELGFTFLTQGKDDILLVTGNGMAIRFSEEDVRPMGLVAAGVNGIKLAAGDFIIGAECVLPGEELLLVSNSGKGWRIPEPEFPRQGRYGAGVAACKLPEGTQLVGMMQGKKSQTGIVHFKDYAAHVIKIGDIAAGKRTKVGQELVAVKPGDKVVGLSTMIEMATGEGKEGKTEQGRGKSGKKPRRRK